MTVDEAEVRWPPGRGITFDGPTDYAETYVIGYVQAPDDDVWLLLSEINPFDNYDAAISEGAHRHIVSAAKVIEGEP